MFAKFLTAAALATCVTSTAATAQQTQEWKKVGDWEIVVDKKTKGCIMQKFYDNGFLLQFGALPEREAGFFAVYRQEWTDIKYGQPTGVKFYFDGVEFDGTAVGTITKPWYGGYAEVNDPEIVYDFAKKYVMKIEAQNTFELSLDGTFNGVKELRACQQATQPM